MSKVEQLHLMADKLRIHSLRSTHAAGSGHPTSCMSMAEIMSVLFFSELREGDEFILSKGHAAPILYAALAEAGFIPREELLNLRKLTSDLEGHPTPNLSCIKVATGSLGQGLPAGVGMALAIKLEHGPGRVFVVLGDGECAEGSVWEAANAAAHYRLNNLCAIIDMNRLGQSGETMFGHAAEEYRARFEAFGWHAVTADGHDIQGLLNALVAFKKGERPVAIICRTFKGRGVSFLENREGWHGKSLDDEQLEKALGEIGAADISLPSKFTFRKAEYSTGECPVNEYTTGQEVATRNAFGSALVNLGRTNERIIALDGDVRNSTMTEGFFKEFPGRGFNTYIAEQNMTGMALGLSARGFIPFVATFAAFFTRAHDFIRMAAYSRANIKFAGSHSGVHIGEDGPSQMGLEDISMFLSVPGAVILYPSDAVSAEKLTIEMARHSGISYMKTTRAKTPVLYSSDEAFPIGGLKVLRKSDADTALVIGAGITVHEALKAHDILRGRGTAVRVMDLYSVHPVDAEALSANARECGGRVIVAEDQYFGGIGAVISAHLGAVRHLYVKEIPRSGKPEELLRRYGIDAEAIVREYAEL